MHWPRAATYATTPRADCISEAVRSPVTVWWLSLNGCTNQKQNVKRAKLASHVLHYASDVSIALQWIAISFTET